MGETEVVHSPTIEELAAHLIFKEEDYKNTYEFEQIMSHGNANHSEEDGLSTAMRLLIHYVGDIH